MRKLQTIGKASGRIGATLPGTRTSGSGTFSTLEFQLQQQSQTAVFRPAEIELWTASIKIQKQRGKASTWCSTAEHTSRESDSLLPLHPESCRHCGLDIRKVAPTGHRVSQQIDLPEEIQLIVREFHRHVVTCPYCQANTTADIPSEHSCYLGQ